MNINLSPAERQWGMFCHLAAFGLFVFPAFGNILGPLIIWLLKKDEMQFVDEQGKEALNFQLSLTIYSIIGIILSFVVIGIFLLIALFVGGFVLVVIAAIKANEGESYKYPFTIKIIK